MGGKILVVGGYGNVGRIIGIELADRFPGQIIAAGRNYQIRKASARGLPTVSTFPISM